MIRTSVAAAGFAALLAGLGGAPLAAHAEDASSAPPVTADSTVPDDIRGMVGDWILEQEDESLPKCPITLTDTPAANGWQVAFPEACPAPYPPSASITAWTVDPDDGAVLLLDSANAVTLRLNEDEDGLFDTSPDTTPRLYLLAPYDDSGTGGEPDGAD